jgi:hypothetical protein
MAPKQKPPLGPPMTLGNMGNALIFAASEV